MRSLFGLNKRSARFVIQHQTTHSSMSSPSVSPRGCALTPERGRSVSPVYEPWSPPASRENTQAERRRRLSLSPSPKRQRVSPWQSTTPRRRHTRPRAPPGKRTTVFVLGKSTYVSDWKNAAHQRRFIIFNFWTTFERSAGVLIPKRMSPPRRMVSDLRQWALSHVGVQGFLDIFVDFLLSRKSSGRPILVVGLPVCCIPLFRSQGAMVIVPERRNYGMLSRYRRNFTYQTDL